jgi:hypothetical protein
VTARRALAIAIDHGDPAAVAEAWRAAVGLTLRGAAVTVAVRPGSADGGAAADRAKATLALFGHVVDADPDRLVGDVIEAWTDGVDRGAGPPDPAVLHLVRPGRGRPAWVGAPGVLQLPAPADVDYDALLDAVAAAPVRVW